MHASTSELHVGPDHVEAHEHTKASTRSAHVAPFWHGDDSQSSSSVAQFSPL
jgi:hypothetical protein